MNEQEFPKKKEHGNEPPNFVSSEANKDGEIKREAADHEKRKMIIKRSLISTPYSAPKFVFKRINDFVMHILAKRCPKPLEEISNDFHELEPYAIKFLTMEVVDSFEIQLVDMNVIIDLVENFDKSAEDMSPPITEIMKPLDCIGLTMILHFKPTASSAANFSIDVSKTLKLKAIKFQVVGPCCDLSKKEGEA